MTKLNRIHIKKEKKSYILTILTTIVMIIAIILIGSSMTNSNVYGDSEMEYTEIIVESGDTLWAIAETHSTDNEDVRIMIRLIVEANLLTSDVIHPGDYLKIPKVNK